MRVQAPAVAAVAAAVLVFAGCGSDRAQAPDEPRGAVRPSEGAQEEEERRLEALGMTAQVPDGLVDACSEAAEETQLEVVHCPPVAPMGEPTIEYASGDLSLPGDPPSYGISMRSAGVDDSGSAGHWAIEAAAESVDLEELIIGGIRRARETPDSERIRIGGVPAKVLRVQQGANTFHKGHVVVLWRFRDVDYFVSLHGHGNEPQATLIARALIRQMSACASTGGRQTGHEQCQLVIDVEDAEDAG
jgi:hypothetical protein